MQNVIFGSVAITICVVLYFMAFRFCKEDRYKTTIALIILAGLVLRIFSSCDFYLHEWDERFHALVAKNLIDFPLKPMLYVDPMLDYDYKNWSDNHVWVHKQPFPLYAMAMSMWVFGKNVLAMRLPTILLSTSAIFSTYKIGALLFNKRVAIIAAFLFSINGLIIELTAGRVATDHFDVIFLALISWAVYFILKFAKGQSRWWMIVSAVITGLAILTKWLPALIVIPIWFAADYKNRKFFLLVRDIVLFLFVVCLISMPWQWYISSEFPLESSWEYLYNRKHMFEVLGPHGNSWLYHINRMRIIFGELIYIPLIWFSIEVFRNKAWKKYIVLFVWILIPYIFFTIAKTKMQGYILFAAPAIFLFSALFIEKYRSYSGKWYMALKFICLGLILLPIRYSVERVKPFSDRETNMPWIQELEYLDEIDALKRKVIFNCKQPIQTMFFTSFTAYERTPSIDEIKELNKEGIVIYINHVDELNEGYDNLQFVNYVNISSEK